MERFYYLKSKRINDLPRTTGIYAFKNEGELLYIGKATNIKERVKNHFQQPTNRDDLFINKVSDIGFFETNSEIEALILEAELIKKHQPKFNVIWRDDKNYFYISIEGKCPIVSITHQPIEATKANKYIGPFTDGTALKKTLKLLRKVFPYYTTKHHAERICTYCHLKLCPGPNPDLKRYKQSIKNLVAVLEGKKQKVLKDLKKEMKVLSDNKAFEEAGEARDKFFALEKIISNARIFERQETAVLNWDKISKFLQTLLKTNKEIKRIEGYDVSNIQGNQATASMVVFSEGKPDKDQYRKFKIRISGKPNDTAMIRETLQRRFTHKEWQDPDLILIDGGKPQLSAALSSSKPNIPIMALAKRNNELFLKEKKNPYLLIDMPREIFNLVLQIRDEGHRFAIKYHKYLRQKELLG